jgi:heat shock protein HslJ
MNRTVLNFGNVFLLSFLLTIISCASKKGPDNNWSGKKWVLMEMNGVPVQISNTEKDAHLVFEPEGKTFFGSGGCNRITGMYLLEKKDKIKFDQVATTRMTCDNQAFEDFFLNTLKSINQFSVDDQILLLKKDGTTVMKLK